MRALFTLLLLLQSVQLWAFNPNSLTWQKLALEEKVQRKFNSALGPILKDNQYLVEVNVEVSDPGGPNFEGDNKPTGPRVSDLNMGESRGDYIAFSKVGLEVPVVEKFLDEDRTKLLNLYRYNEAMDLFKNISGISVTVFLSDKLPEDLMNIAKKVVESSKLSVAGVKPNVKYESIPLEWVDPALAEAKKAPEAEKPEQEPKIWAKDWFEWASRWGNAVGLILSIIIFGLIALKLFKDWKEFMENYAARKNEPEQKEETPEEEKQENIEETIVAEATPETEEELMVIAQGFERFQQCLNQHPEDAVNMVRTWLNEDDDVSRLILRGIVQLCSTEELEKLMDGLSEQLRDKWKGFLGEHLEPAELVTVKKHLHQQVVRAFLVPSRIKDSELLNLVMDLNPKSICDFLSKNEQQTGILLNILSPSVIGKVLAEVDDARAEEWLLAGSDFATGTLEESLPQLKDALKAYKASYAPSPFVQRIVALIPNAAPSREITLYRALAKAGNSGMVIDVAKRNFPSELVMELPGDFIKEVVQKYPMTKRIELIQSRPEEQRETLLDIMAEKGSQAREMLDMELENIARDPSKSAAILNRAEDIWQEFVRTTRTTLTKNQSYAGYAEQLVKEWGQKLGHGLQAIEGGKAA